MIQNTDKYLSLKDIQEVLFMDFGIKSEIEELNESFFDESIKQYSKSLRRKIEDFREGITTQKPDWNVQELIKLKDKFLELIKQ